MASTPPPTGLSPGDRAYLQQQAVNDFSRTMSEIQGVYFGHLRELSSSGTMGDSGLQGMKNLAAANQTGFIAQGAVTLAALGATFAGSPVAGAVVAMGGTALVNQYLGGAQVQNAQDQQRGQAETLAGQIRMMGGGSTVGIYNNAMAGLDSTRYATGVQRLAAFDALNQGAYLVP